jgi:hypothetical protein
MDRQVFQSREDTEDIIFKANALREVPIENKVNLKNNH